MQALKYAANKQTRDDTHTHTHTQAHTHKHTHTQAHTSTHTHTTHTHTHTHTCTQMPTLRHPPPSTLPRTAYCMHTYAHIHGCMQQYNTCTHTWVHATVYACRHAYRRSQTENILTCFRSNTLLYRTCHTLPHIYTKRHAHNPPQTATYTMLSLHASVYTHRILNTYTLQVTQSHTTQAT